MEIADSIAQAKKDAESKKPCNRVGKYVYVDQVGVLHTELSCGAINEGGTLSGYATDEDGDDVDVSRSIKCGSGVKRILLKDMDKSLLKNHAIYVLMMICMSSLYNMVSLQRADLVFMKRK